MCGKSARAQLLHLSLSQARRLLQGAAAVLRLEAGALAWVGSWAGPGAVSGLEGAGSLRWAWLGVGGAEGGAGCPRWAHRADNFVWSGVVLNEPHVVPCLCARLTGRGEKCELRESLASSILAPHAWGPGGSSCGFLMPADSTGRWPLFGPVPA